MLNKQQQAVIGLRNTNLERVISDTSHIEEIDIDEMFFVIAVALKKIDGITIEEREEQEGIGVSVGLHENVLLNVCPEPLIQEENKAWVNGGKTSTFRLIKIHDNVNICRDLLDFYMLSNPQKYMVVKEGIMIFEDVNLSYGKSLEELVDIITCFYRNSLSLATSCWPQYMSLN